MRESIILIKWCGALSIVFLALTYIATINSENHFITLNTVWISNDFLYTLFGGLFASTLVVFLCEIRKYYSAKSNAEQYLFYQSVYLYQAFRQMKQIIEDYLDHTEWIITENLFDESVRIIQCEINAIQTTDYATIKGGEKSLMDEHYKFRNDTVKKLNPVLQSNIRLKLAISEMRSELFQRQMDPKNNPCSRRIITSELPQIAKVLNEELVIVTNSVDLVDRYSASIDNHCNKRFGWDKLKEEMVILHIEEVMR